MRKTAIVSVFPFCVALGRRAYISTEQFHSERALRIPQVEAAQSLSDVQAAIPLPSHAFAVLLLALSPAAGWNAVGSHATNKLRVKQAASVTEARPQLPVSVSELRVDRCDLLSLVSLFAGHIALLGSGRPAWADTVKMEGLNGAGKSKTYFSDFERSSSGLQYKDFKNGTGPIPRAGDTVFVDWSGVTIGYQGRYFQARNKPKGGEFSGDGFQDVLTFKVGDGTVIPGVDEAIRSMSKGGIRRIIVPEEIGYPRDGFSKIGPKPTTFSGERALDFVLSSKGGLMDKTLMFDLKLVGVRSKE